LEKLRIRVLRLRRASSAQKSSWNALTDGSVIFGHLGGLKKMFFQKRLQEEVEVEEF